MTKITVIVTDNYRPVSLAAIMDVFTSVNLFSMQAGNDAPFQIEQLELKKGSIVPLQPLIQTSNNRFVNGYQKQRIKNKTPDLILIPAFNGEELSESIRINTAWIPWLQKQYQKGAEIATFCTGAFLAGTAGILRNKKATTHLMYMDTFSRLYPDVILDENAVLTDHSGVYTSGGATSSFHLMLHLIKKICGVEMSLKIAKMFAIDPDRSTQSYFSEFKPARKHEDPVVTGLQDLIENHYKEDVSISDLAEKIPASRRTIYRRFKKATGLTPHKYLQKIRIETARNLLENSEHQVNEVMYKCGYNDPKTFRTLFRESVGLSPTSYRRKFRVA
jgi:transcriptional regulator GlxA family with amidase domain